MSREKVEKGEIEGKVRECTTHREHSVTLWQTNLVTVPSLQGYFHNILPSEHSSRRSFEKNER